MFVLFECFAVDHNTKQIKIVLDIKIAALSFVTLDAIQLKALKHPAPGGCCHLESRGSRHPWACEFRRLRSARRRGVWSMQLVAPDRFWFQPSSPQADGQGLSASAPSSRIYQKTSQPITDYPHSSPSGASQGLIAHEHPRRAPGRTVSVRNPHPTSKPIPRPLTGPEVQIPGW